MTDEPRRHAAYMALLALVIVATIPTPFAGGRPAWLLGVPAWLWWSLGWTAALSVLTAWGILRYWRDDDDG